MFSWSLGSGENFQVVQQKNQMFPYYSKNSFNAPSKQKKQTNKKKLLVFTARVKTLFFVSLAFISVAL